MAAVPGKNKLARAMRIYWDDSGGTPRNLSADLVPNSLSGLGFVGGFIDLTGESETVVNGLADRLKSTIKGKLHANDTATTGATTVTNPTVGSVGTLTVECGDAGAAPQTGDLVFSGEFVLLGNTLSPDSGKLTHDCEWQPSGATPPAWSTKA